MEFSLFLVCLVFLGVVTVISAEDQSKGPSRQTASTSASNNVKEFQFTVDTSRPSKHTTNVGQTDLPLLYRSIDRSAGKSNGYESKDKHNGSNTVPNNGNKQSTPSQSTGGKVMEFFWPKKILPFSDSTKNQNDKSNKSFSDKPKLFETSVGSLGSSGLKMGVAFWPRNSSSTSTKSFDNKDQEQYMDTITQHGPDGQIFPNVDMSRHQESETSTDNNHLEGWASHTSSSAIDSKNDPLRMPDNNPSQSHSAHKTYSDNFLKGNEGQSKSDTDDKKPKDEPKRASSPFSPREDFTSKSSKDGFVFQEVQKEPQPPITVTDSNFKLPDLKSNRLGDHEGLNQPNTPMFDMPTATDANSGKLMTQMMRRKGLAPGGGDRIEGSDGIEMEASRSDQGRRWGQDVPDRMKEFRKFKLKKQHPVMPPPRQPKDILAEQMSTTGRTPLATSPELLMEDYKARIEKMKAPLQAWSSLGIGQRRLRLSKRLTELMSKNRESRRARLFGETEKVNDKPVETVQKI